jgi:serine/threonine protein kinase
MGLKTSKPKKNSWDDVKTEINILSKSVHFKEITPVKELKGGNGFPYIIDGHFCKIQFKSKHALINLMNIKNIKSKTKSTGDEFLCNFINYYETKKAVFTLYKRYDMDLAQFLNTRKTSITPNNRHNVLLSILNAIIFLHDNGFAHRDIKVENILMKTPNHAILCDMDHSYPLSNFALKGTKEYYPSINVMKALVCNRKDISLSDKMKWIDYYAFGKTIGYVMVMTSKRQDKYQTIWDNWLNISRTSCYPYSTIIKDLKEQSIWWNIIYKLCIENERNIFNPKKKMFDLGDFVCK